MKPTTILFQPSVKQMQKVMFASQLKVHLFLAVIYAYPVVSFAISTVPHGLDFAPYLIFPVLILACLVAYLGTIPRSLARLNSGLLDRKRMMEFDDEGFTTRFETGSNSYTVWPDVHRILRGNDVTTIYLTKMYFVQVPDFAWPSAVELNQYLELLRSKSLLK